MFFDKLSLNSSQINSIEAKVVLMSPSPAIHSPTKPATQNRCISLFLDNYSRLIQGFFENIHGPETEDIPQYFSMTIQYFPRLLNESLLFT